MDDIEERCHNWKVVRGHGSGHPGGAGGPF